MREFAELQEYYKIISSKSKHTQRSYEYALSDFMEYFDIISLDDIKEITPSDVQNWMFHLAKGSDSKSVATSHNTANTRFRVVRAFFNWLVSFEHIKSSPCESVDPYKEEKNLKTYLTVEERDRMINACTNIKNKLLISLAFYTGMRRTELVNVKIKDIENGKITINGKGKKQRRLPLNEYVLNLINKYLKTRDDDSEYLFVSSRSGFSDDLKDGDYHSITPEAYRQIVKTAAKRAGFADDKIDKISTHTLRRSFAIHLTTDAKASSFQVQRAMGHASLITTEIYLEAAGSEVAYESVLSLSIPLGQ